MTVAASDREVHGGYRYVFRTRLAIESGTWSPVVT